MVKSRTDPFALPDNGTSKGLPLQFNSSDWKTFSGFLFLGVSNLSGAFPVKTSEV